MKIFSFKSKRGSALAYALAIIFAVSLIIMSIFQYATSQAKNAYREQYKQIAFQVAEAGANFYRWYLAHETDGKTVQQVRDFWQTTNPYPYGLNVAGNSVYPYEADYKDDNGNIIGHYQISVQVPDPSSTIVNVTITGWSMQNPNVKKNIKIRFRRSAWSDYAILTNAYSHFDANWNIKGKIMSNTGVHFDGVSNNVVSAGLPQYYDPELSQNKPGVWTSWTNEYNTSQDSQVFLGGKKFPVPQKDFIGVAVDMGMMQNEAQKPNNTTINSCTATGCYFDSQLFGRHIILRNDGKFAISIVSAITNNSNSIKTEKVGSQQIFDIPNDGLIFVNGNVWVEGKIDNKRVTIVAANMPANGTNANIYVGSNNLLYTNFNGSDILGLISQGNIEFTTDGPNDLVLDGAFLAQNGGIMKRDYNPNCCGGGCEAQKNSLGIFGSVASNQTPVFTVTKACNNTKAIGFQSKQITYDNSLLYYPPPFFPTDSNYIIDNWEEI